MNKLRFIPLALSLFLLTTHFASAEIGRSPTDNSLSPIGTNFHFFTDWSSEYPFINLFRMARPWITSSDVWDTNEWDKLEADLDENGYPTRLPSADDPNANYRYVTTLMMTDVGPNYPGGEYNVYYDGEGTITYGRDAVLVSSSPGHDVINVTPSSGIMLRITATTQGNHIRNLRVVMPGYTAAQEASQVYHDDFLNVIKKYRVLRYMDWMRTNWDLGGPIDRREVSDIWTDRSRPTDAFYTTERGVPLEVMVDLANYNNADPWFNHSHLATDNDIYLFAEHVRDTLNDDRFVYVEYSNEIWNYGFQQGNWMEEQAEADPTISEGNGLQKRLSWYGKRSAEMCNIWKQVWAEQSERVICVIATQAANAYIGQQMLDCPLWSGAPCHSHVDAVAIAPYFGQHIGHNAYLDEVRLWLGEADGGLNKLFRELEFGDVLTDRRYQYIFKTKLGDALAYVTEYKQMADDRGISLVSYEGGQHLVGFGGAQNDMELNALFEAANDDPRMKTAYDDYFAGWHGSGAGFFVHYANAGKNTKWGFWGASQYLTNADSQKRSSVETYVDNYQCDWDACTVPDGTPTAVGLEAQSAENRPLWLAIPLILLVGATFLVLGRRRSLLWMVLLIGCSPAAYEPAAVEVLTPDILSFTADVTEYVPGVPFTLTWASAGVGSLNLETVNTDALIGGTTVETVSATDSLIITPAVGQIGALYFKLTSPDGSVSRDILLEQTCSTAWVFSPAPTRCAAFPIVYTDAVALSFENGFMMYVPSLSAVWVMSADGSRTWDVRDLYDPLVDPFEDPSINPPPLSMLYEPTGALGKVWRETPEVRDTLGWATLPLTLPYVATMQCTDYVRGGLCLLNAASQLGFVLYFSRDPMWEINYDTVLNP